VQYGPVSTEGPRRRRVRGRVFVGALVIVFVGSGIATAQMVATDDDSPRVVAPASTTAMRGTRAVAETKTTTIPSGPIDLGFTRSLSFVNANVGFALNGRYLIRTEDGGRTWRRISRLENDMIHFATASDGVASGNGPTRITRDGGARWAPLAEPAGYLVLGWTSGRLWATSPCAARPCAPQPLSVSDDVGRTWRRVGPAVPGDQAAPVVTTSGSTTYVLEARSGSVNRVMRLLATDDGGATWRHSSVPCAQGDRRFLAATDVSLLLVCPGAAYSGVDQRKPAFLSTDGGHSWTRAPAEIGAGNVAQLTSFGSVYLAGLGRGGAAVTSDGGNSWRAPSFPLPADEGGVGFSTLPGVGVWASKGGAGGIWFSADGIHWEKRAGG
jgi:photosystem II stability/assembly factor-like uncharacterized protein